MRRFPALAVVASLLTVATRAQAAETKPVGDCVTCHTELGIT